MGAGQRSAGARAGVGLSSVTLRSASGDRANRRRGLSGARAGTDFLIGASFGYSFYPVPAWVTVDVLHRLRLQNPSSGVSTRVEAGWMIIEHFGFAAQVEIQPSFGRDSDLAPDVPAPVPTVFGFGCKLLAPVTAGFGLAGEAMLWPDVLNDGPGYRLALSLTYER